jgi:hypothetical protein
LGQCRSALEPWILRLHGGAALLALIQFGTLLPSHVARGWRVGQNRAPGAVVVAGVALLLASGYGLYYVGNESGRAAISALHWITGIALIPLFLTHLYVGRRADTEAVPDLDTEVVHSPFGRHAESASGHKRHRRRHLR